MFEKLLDIPEKFWIRLGIIFLTYVGANILMRKVHLPFWADPTFLLVFFSIVTLILIYSFNFFAPKVFKNPFFVCVVLQTFFVWIFIDTFISKYLHISFKPKVLVFGLGFVAGVYYFFKYFNFLWKFSEFRFVVFFNIITFIFYFFNASTFNISQEGPIYGFMGGSENQSAKMVVLIGSICIFFSSVVGLSVFNNIAGKEQIDKLVINSSKIWSIMLGVLMAIIILLLGQKISGFQISSSIFFGLILTFKYYIDNFIDQSKMKLPKYLNHSLLILCFFMFVLTVYQSNKTSLIAFLAGLFIYVFICYKESLQFKIVEFLGNSRYRVAIILLTIIVLISLTFYLGLVDKIIAVINKSFNAVTAETGVSSFSIRKTNWKYFIDYWATNLDEMKALFGFGLGESRRIIFYLSATQTPRYLYLVQTTHNQFTEIFFDYGLMGLLFYMPAIIIIIKNINNIFSERVSKDIKLFSNLSIFLWTYYFIYHLLDGLRVTTAITFFTTIMFVQAIIYSLSLKPKNKV